MSYSRGQFGDPAAIVEAEQIRTGGCRICARAEWVFGKPICSNDLTFPRCRRKRNGFKLQEKEGRR